MKDCGSIDAVSDNNRRFCILRSCVRFCFLLDLKFSARIPELAILEDLIAHNAPYDVPYGLDNTYRIARSSGAYRTVSKL